MCVCVCVCVCVCLCLCVRVCVFCLSVSVFSCMRVWACVRVSTVCVCERMCVCARASPQVCAPSNTHATRLTHAAAQRTSGPRTHHAGTLHTCAAHRSTHSHTRPHSTPTLTMKKQKAAVHLSKPGARAAAAPADTGARQRRTRADQHRNTVRCARGASPCIARTHHAW